MTIKLFVLIFLARRIYIAYFFKWLKSSMCRHFTGSRELLLAILAAFTRCRQGGIRSAFNGNKFSHEPAQLIRSHWEMGLFAHLNYESTDETLFVRPQFALPEAIASKHPLGGNLACLYTSDKIPL